MIDQLAGKRILVVEDEYFIASDITRALQKADAIVLGPVGDLDKGMSLAASEGPDAAVLDVNLEGSNSFSLAELLEKRSVPYMFLTGYDGWSLPHAYRAVPRVAKPFAMQAVLKCVASLVGSEVSR